jgi:hypothetical protein
VSTLVGPTRLVDWVHRWAEVGDGLPVTAPEASTVLEILDAAGESGDRPLVDGRTLTARDVAICAAMASCPPGLASLAFAAARTVLRRPSHTLGITDLDHPGPAEVVQHPVTVLAGPATRTHGLWSGYGALSAPAPEVGPAVGRTVSLVLHLTVPAYRTNVPVLGHPGWYGYTVAEHPELTVRARNGRPDAFVVACAAVSAPRGLYLGGAAGRPHRIGRISADGLLTAVGDVDAHADGRAALLVVNPTTCGQLADAGAADLVAVVAREAGRLRSDGAALVDRLDVLTVVAGGDSQTWVAAAVGPPGSRWEYA